MTTPAVEHPKDHYDQCAGCARYCLAKRATDNGVEYVAAPWCAMVATRKRPCVSGTGRSQEFVKRALGGKIAEVYECAVVCSRACLTKLQSDPSWPKVDASNWKITDPDVDGERLAVRGYSTVDTMPTDPTSDWITLRQ